MQVTVGKGGVAYGPVGDKVGMNVHHAPAGDDGLSGYPGSHSSIVSPTKGELLRCDGGSGATPGSVDDFSGSAVAGNLAGANTGSGNPPHPVTNRPAEGPCVTPGGPGACGPDNFGIGTYGASTWVVGSGSTSGGLTPLGAGSGGSIGRYGCYVTPSFIGTCVSPQPGRDGIVHIDVMY